MRIHLENLKMKTQSGSKLMHETDYTKQFCQKQMHETKNTLYVRLSVKHLVKIFRFLGND